MLLLAESTRIFGNLAVLTCLEVCWGACPTEKAVFCGSCILSSEGFAAQVHSCCSLQLSMFFCNQLLSLHRSVGREAVCHRSHPVQTLTP